MSFMKLEKSMQSTKHEPKLKMKWVLSVEDKQTMTELIVIVNVKDAIFLCSTNCIFLPNELNLHRIIEPRACIVLYPNEFTKILCV
jgi:hypothetical protein